jgi:hypothetical protein
MNQYHLRAKDTSVMPKNDVPVEAVPAAADISPPELPASPGGGVGEVTQMNDLGVNETPPPFNQPDPIAAA